MKSKIIATILNYLSAFLLFSFGIIYFFKSSFMPYHAQALGEEWTVLNQPTQTLILALMRCVAGGYLAVAVVIFIMQKNLYKIGKKSIAWCIFLSGWIVTGASVYATILVRLKTEGNPPTTLACAGLVFLLFGLFINLNLIKNKKNCTKY